MQSVPGSSSCSKPKLSNKAKISRDGLAKILDPWVQILSVATSNWKLIVNYLFVNLDNARNVLFWNLNYWDSASTLAGEVRDPRRVFPQAQKP